VHHELTRDLDCKLSIDCEHDSAGLCIAIFVVYLLLLYIYLHGIYVLVLLQSVASTVARTLIPSHKSPVVRGPTVQTAEDNLEVRAPGLSIKCYSPFWGCDPVGLSYLEFTMIKGHLTELTNKHSYNNILPRVTDYYV